MNLRSRLDQHRHDRGMLQSGRTVRAFDSTEPMETSALSTLPPAIAAQLSPSLAERLGRLRPRSSPAIGAESRADALADIVRLVEGEQVADQLVRVVRKFPLPHRHGAARLSPRPEVPRRLYLDTETTGLAGGTGTVAFVVGLARHEPTALVVTQYLLLGFADESRLLACVGEEIGRAEQLVTFNGASFDLPLLRTRFRMHRLDDPIEHCSHDDLLPWARRNRGVDWPNARLQTIERHGIGFARIDDLPGHEVPETWRRWLQYREGDALPRVLEHNRLDLVTLAVIDELADRGIAFAAPAPAPARSGRSRQVFHRGQDNGRNVLLARDFQRNRDVKLL